MAKQEEMMYRPDDWKNPFEVRVSTDEASLWADNLQDLRKEAYEAGADAMLAELKKEAIYIRTVKGWGYLKCSYEEWLHGNKVGYIIFIPEE